MTKTFKKSILFMAFALFSICNIALASNSSLNNWPDKEKSARIIHTLYLQATQELNQSASRVTFDQLRQDKIVYLKRLASAIKHSDKNPEEVYKEVHNRHLDQAGLTQGQIDNYNKLGNDVEEYILAAG